MNCEVWVAVNANKIGLTPMSYNTKEDLIKDLFNIGDTLHESNKNEFIIMNKSKILWYCYKTPIFCTGEASMGGN